MIFEKKSYFRIISISVIYFISFMTNNNIKEIVMEGFKPSAHYK
jgi:hypothetical protein